MTGKAASVGGTGALLCALALLSVAVCAGAATAQQAIAGAKQAVPPSEPTPEGASAQLKPLDWDKLTEEATELLSQYIQIDTSNPPGNEIGAARMLREKFLSDGIPATVWQPKPGRGIVAARLRGIGKHNETVILLSHIDVAPANPKEWKEPPFSGLVKDGEIWGRGALDDKGPGVVEMMAMFAIKRSGLLLNRDVLFIATGDEEAGGADGAGWLVKNQRQVFSDAGFVLNEGGGIVFEPDGRRLYTVAISEKTPLWLKLSAAGPAGHAAIPPEQTSVTRLVRALGRLIDFSPPIRIVDPVQNYFSALAALHGGPVQLYDLAQSLKDPAFAKQFLADPEHNALVRDTVTPTELDAGQRPNVIPAGASAMVDCRLLPGTDPKTFLQTLRKVISDDGVTTEILLTAPSASSPPRSILMNAIQALASSDGDSPVVTTMDTGFTDSRYFRQLGITAYGFIPLGLTLDRERTVHAMDERISVKALGGAIQRMVQILKFLGGQ